MEKFLKFGWKPKCKQDVVDLLMLVQEGKCSCRKASDILFPEFKNIPVYSKADLARIKSAMEHWTGFYPPK